MDDFSIAMNLSLFGIGATLQADDGYCKITQPRARRPGGPEWIAEAGRPHRRGRAKAIRSRWTSWICHCPMR